LSSKYTQKRKSNILTTKQLVQEKEKEKTETTIKTATNKTKSKT
jgi:hypothetical protein